MTRKWIVFFALIVLSACILIGGCTPPENEFKSLKELVNILPNEEEQEPFELPRDIVVENIESFDIELYFATIDKKDLKIEKRTINKVEGLGRKTIEELLKGPQSPDYVSAFPEGTTLLDINVKPDGLCIVDLSSEARFVNNIEEETLMISAIVNTLSQFPTISEVSFMVNGKEVTTIGGFVDLSEPISTK